MTFHVCADLVTKQSHTGDLTIIVSAVTDALRKSYNSGLYVQDPVSMVYSYSKLWLRSLCVTFQNSPQLSLVCARRKLQFMSSRK